ncbi:unnamed protein product [Bursaphelenchus okinawaensis]|uniref:Uncharacterized protein n=1 Tax=Bursaphelenchus okinawaensis TaxID=465554 RepID=A0A811L057_9BILA|nr:unnamed protein product [Bursaphelenchus okinawaensis]CAG9115116.1 unnamed protein product [Bursaphelenchus okinawaensis]
MFELHPEYIDLFLHRASTVALFEAKARKELQKLSSSDKVLFKDCATSAKTVIAMARCVNRVLDKRDKFNDEIEETLPDDNNCDFDQSDGNWVMGLMRSIYRTFGCPEGKKPKIEKEDGFKVNINITKNSMPKPIPKVVTVPIVPRQPLRVKDRLTMYRYNRTAPKIRPLSTTNFQKLQLPAEAQQAQDRTGSQNGLHSTGTLKNLHIEDFHRSGSGKHRSEVEGHRSEGIIQRSGEVNRRSEGLNHRSQSVNGRDQEKNEANHAQYSTNARQRHRKLFNNAERIVMGKDRSSSDEERHKLDIKKLKRREIRPPPPAYPVSKRCEVPHNVGLLRNVQSYFDKMNHVIRFTYKMGKHNERFFKEMNENVAFQNRPPNGKSPYEEMQKMMQQIEEFDDKGVISILSPKLFNLMPDQPDPESKRYMSPNMFSFQEEGFLPLPKLFRMSNSDECETLKWLDLMLDFTGGTRILNGHMERLGEHMKTVDSTLYPRVLETEKMEEHYDYVHSFSTDEQKKQMKSEGYAPLNAKQLELMYGQNGILPSYKVDINAHQQEPDAVLEKTIRRLASLSDEEVKEVEKMDSDAEASTIQPNKVNEDGDIPFRTKRQAVRRPSFFDFRDLDPFAITQRIGNPNILGHYVLSPYAFYLQVFSPTLLNMEIINPRAFIATIFSPVVLVLRVLSPSAFRLMLFSPLMLIAWVMVPEAFLAKIFSPKLLDARILSPESFSAIVLSPGAGVMRIASPNAMNVLVLSPSIFTYGLWSGNRYVVQVLSPGLVGVDQHPLLKPLP